MFGNFYNLGICVHVNNNLSVSSPPLYFVEFKSYLLYIQHSAQHCTLKRSICPLKNNLV